MRNTTYTGPEVSVPRTEVAGGTVAYRVLGSGPSVVLTHGTPSWSYLWRRIAPVLAERYTVYTWDLLGYGHSETRAGALPSIALHAQTLAELVNQWQLTEPFLVGHDIGGATTLRALLIDHVPARGMALIDAVAFTPWIGPDTRHMQQNIQTYRTMPNSLFQAVVGQHFSGVTHRTLPKRIRKRYLDFYSSGAGQQRWLNRTEGYDENGTNQFIPLLGTIDIPTTIIWGDQDDWLPLDLADRLSSAIPGAAKITIPAAGHFAMEDQPKAVTNAILDAIARSASE
jgi:pimeloyl-ACP methyl ester carboxylesterase